MYRQIGQLLNSFNNKRLNIFTEFVELFLRCETVQQVWLNHYNSVLGAEMDFKTEMVTQNACFSEKKFYFTCIIPLPINIQPKGGPLC